MNFLLVPLPEDVLHAKIRGDFTLAARRIRQHLREDIPDDLRKRLEYELEILRRLRIDYPIPRERAIEILARNIANFREDELDRWISEGYVDRIMIDGRERYFSRFLDNLVFANPRLGKRRKPSARRARIQDLILSTIIRISSGELRKYRVTAGIRVSIRKKVPGPYRVWLPVPREGYQVENVRILDSSLGIDYISDAPQRTAYFETDQREIRLEFSYDISEVSGGVEGRIEESHLKEKRPHIVLSPFIKNLAESIVGDADDDFEKARRIYSWVTTHMRYFYVRNYGTYEDIAEYAAVNLKGDCGFHAILFIALCRAVGIPAKWQSGWFVTPHYVGPHDWAQVYVNSSWYPVDASFGNARRHTSVENEFYFGNLDAFRMIANDDLLGEFKPKKNFYRSDPVDNQVGEVENGRGNIYYDAFSWKLYLKEFRRI